MLAYLILSAGNVKEHNHPDLTEGFKIYDYDTYTDYTIYSGFSNLTW